MSTTAPVLAPADLAAITADVWAAFLLAEESDGLVETPAGPADADAVHAWVDVTGAWTGRIDLVLDAVTADLAARTMLCLPQAGRADVLDAVGELANMVGGNVKSLVPAPSALGLPVVGSGPVPEVGVVECAVDLDWSGHAVRVVVRRGAGRER